MAVRREIEAFDGLRGLAAWWVVFYHFDPVVAFPNVVHSFVHEGALAVDLFFVLSGFVIALSYNHVFKVQCTLRDWTWFIGIRLARIYPLHIFMLIVYGTIPIVFAVTGRPVSPFYNLPYFFESLFLVQNWGFADQLGWNPPAWSISAELMFYSVFPIMCVCLASTQKHLGRLLIALLTVVAGLYILGFVFGSLRADITQSGAIRCILECALGMLTFYASGGESPRIVTSYVLILGSAGLAIIYAMGFAPDYAVLPFAFALLLWSIINPKMVVSRVLSVRFLRWLGMVSFSTYMVHYFIRDCFKLTLYTHVPDWLLLVLYVVAICIASAILYRLIEVPGRRIGRCYVEGMMARTKGPALLR